MKLTKQSMIVASLLFTFLVPASPIVADEKQVFGHQLMTEQEREEHRTKMRSFRTEKEREAYRQEHHKRMQERAKKKGVTLPDQPMPRRGMGPGGGMGSGPGR